MGRTLARLSMKFRWWIFAGVAALTVILGLMIPKITVDTDPENMLSAEQSDRVEHERVKELFDLYDMIVVGLVNRTHANGVYNAETLTALHELTRFIEDIDGVISRDVMSLATVDNVEQVAPGTISFDWIMDRPPANDAEAAGIQEVVERLPMFHGTLVSEDSKAAGIYVPIADKNESHRIATEIREFAASLDSAGEVHITGQPVAQDTFGVEMFRQMAISAPAAGLLIFLLLLYFFRSVAVVAGAMILSMVTVIITMGTLIGMGFTVHIMSSMIPIFLMPIAVVDSIHVLSDFADRLGPDDDPRDVMRGVMQDLWKPLLFTSLTTSVGFASLLLAPIPPVQIFGVFVAFGVLVAIALTYVFLPAWIGVMPRSVIDRLAARMVALRNVEDGEEGGRMHRALRRFGGFAVHRARWALTTFAVVLAIAVWGITQIQINDNPTRWFKADHEIRVADQVLNDHFAGTYEAYLELEQTRGGGVMDQLDQRVDSILDQAEGEGFDLRDEWKAIVERARSEEATTTFNNLAFALDDRLFDAGPDEAEWWDELLLAVESVQSKALYFQSPEALAWMAELQESLEANEHVGKSNSLADLVRTINRELVSGEPDDYRIPDSAAGVAQTILSYQSSHRPHDLWHFITPDYRQASIWLQLPSGDNQDMQQVLDAVDEFVANNPPPEGVELTWAGSTYINLVWQNEMVAGMISALMSALVAVLIMTTVLFRSFVFGTLAIIPLLITITVIYGVMGLIGKDFDMPVAVLSSLSLGLSVDFAIHFLQRLRDAHAETGRWRAAIARVFEEPARAITRNAVVISLGFLPLLFAALVPYITVGILLASIMALSALVTLLILPAILSSAPRLFFGGESG